MNGFLYILGGKAAVGAGRGEKDQIEAHNTVTLTKVLMSCHVIWYEEWERRTPSSSCRQCEKTGVIKDLNQLYLPPPTRPPASRQYTPSTGGVR